MGQRGVRVTKRAAQRALGLILSLGLLFLTIGFAWGHEPQEASPIGDTPAFPGHIHQRDITSGHLGFKELLTAGKRIFQAGFNTLDGAGRPEATGSGMPLPRERREFPENFNRSSGPDANSCAGCHNQPRVGGGGENVTNVFVLAQNLDFTTSIDPAVANERNTLGMFGLGAIEMLAREMTRDLRRIRARALAQAGRTGQRVSVSLDTKGVNFGRLIAFPDGTVDTSQIERVQRLTDLPADQWLVVTEG